MDMLARLDSVGQTSISCQLRRPVGSPCSSHQPLQQDNNFMHANLTSSVWYVHCWELRTGLQVVDLGMRGSGAVRRKKFNRKLLISGSVSGTLKKLLYSGNRLVFFKMKINGSNQHR